MGTTLLCGHLLLDAVDAVNGRNELGDALDPNDITDPSLDTTWIARL